MTPKNPNWTELKKEPFGPYIADEILQYRSDEIERIIAWKAENPLPEPIDIEIGSNRGCFLCHILLQCLMVLILRIFAFG